MSMIESIEAKAMQEIEFLRRDKINLMRKLNEEIRGHNQQKKMRIILEQHLKKMEGGAQIVEFLHANLDMYDTEGEMNLGIDAGKSARNTTGNMTKAKVKQNKTKKS